MALNLFDANPLSRTNADLLLIGPLGKNLSEISIKLQTFPLKKLHLKKSAQWQPSYHSLSMLSVLTNHVTNEYVREQDHHNDGLVQDCSNSTANALELLQSCTEPSICSFG